MVSRLLKPDAPFRTCSTVLQGFVAQRSNSFAQSQLVRIVDRLIVVIDSGKINGSNPILQLVTDSLHLEVSLAQRLLTALLSSPAMEVSNGIRAAFASEFELAHMVGLPIYSQLNPARRDLICQFLNSVLIFYPLYDVGRKPLKQPNWKRATSEELQNTPQGQEISDFLVDRNRRTWNSKGWYARERDVPFGALVRAGYMCILEYENKKIPGCGLK